MVSKPLAAEDPGLGISFAAPADIAWKSAALRNVGCDPRRSETCAAVTLRARFTAFAYHASPRSPRTRRRTRIAVCDRQTGFKPVTRRLGKAARKTTRASAAKRATRTERAVKADSERGKGKRATGTERAVKADRERACRGVGGAKPLGVTDR